MLGDYTPIKTKSWIYYIAANLSPWMLNTVPFLNISLKRKKTAKLRWEMPLVVEHDKKVQNETAPVEQLRYVSYLSSLAPTSV